MRKCSQDFKTEDPSLDFKLFVFVLFSFLLLSAFQSISTICLHNVGVKGHTITFMVDWKEFLASIPGTANSELLTCISNNDLHQSRQLLLNTAQTKKTKGKYFPILDSVPVGGRIMKLHEEELYIVVCTLFCP